MRQSSAEVREDLVRALRLDLVGPCPIQHGRDAEYENERLPMAPSKWYLSGFLVPRAAPDEQKEDDSSQEELDLGGDADSEGDEDATPDKAPARRVPFPSSIGLSVLIPGSVTHLEALISWGEYVTEPVKEDDKEVATGKLSREQVWQRSSQQARVTIPVPQPRSKPRVVPIPHSNGLKLVITARQADGASAGLPKGVLSLAVFLVNERAPAPNEEKDLAFTFQSTLQLTCSPGFVPRPDPRQALAADPTNCEAACVGRQT